MSKKVQGEIIKNTMPLPEIKLTLRYEDRYLSEKWNDRDADKVVVRTDTHFQKHTISLLISEQPIGSVQLKIDDHWVELPTYKLTVTDDKTEEIKTFQVTRDFLTFKKETTQKSFFSFLGIKRFDKTSFLYENIAFEPEKDSIESFELSRYRKLSDNSFSYQFQSGDKKLLIYAGNLESFVKPSDIDSSFIIVDKSEGQSFIGDISYREKMLKLTPKVTLQVVKRTKIAKEFSFDNKGKIQKLIYL